ncbi:hypothetical protein RYX36_021146 [Vicia faba]
MLLEPLKLLKQADAEIGEPKFVLDIGRTSLQHQDVKPYADDLVLSMTLAEVPY